jgi:hypothetical protein
MKQSAFTLVFAFLLTGCSVLSPDINQASYEVTTPAAKHPEFKEELNRIAKALANELDWDYCVFREIPGSTLEVDFRPKTHTGAFANLGMDWNRSVGMFSISWTGLPPKTPEFKRLRNCVENVLNENQTFKWRFYQQKKRLILY